MRESHEAERVTTTLIEVEICTIQGPRNSFEEWILLGLYSFTSIFPITFDLSPSFYFLSSADLSAAFARSGKLEGRWWIAWIPTHRPSLLTVDVVPFGSKSSPDPRTHLDPAISPNTPLDSLIALPFFALLPRLSKAPVPIPGVTTPALHPSFPFSPHTVQLFSVRPTERPRRLRNPGITPSGPSLLSRTNPSSSHLPPTRRSLLSLPGDQRSTRTTLALQVLRKRPCGSTFVHTHSRFLGQSETYGTRTTEH